MINYIHKLHRDSLFRNSFYLMLSMVIIAASGFIFWAVIARSSPASTVGIATTILSVSSLISLLGMGGFDTVFVRFLAKSKDPNKVINTGMSVTALLSGVLAVAFCLATPILSPAISFLAHSPLYIVLFAVFTIFTTWNTVTNAALIANKKGGHVLAINIAFSILKLVFPFAIPTSDPMIIFTILGVTQVVNVVLSYITMVRHIHYKPYISFDIPTLREIFTFSGANYLANIFNLLPDSVLPIIVLNQLGAHTAAYFYIAFTIANLLYTIVFSTAQATLAEASHDEEKSSVHMRRGLLIIIALLIPAIIGVIVLAPFVLEVFGKDYRDNAATLINILAVSGILIAFYSVLGTYFKISHRLRALVAMTGTNSLAIIVFAALFTSNFGLVGVGWSWFFGSFAAIIVGLGFVIKDRWSTR